MLSNVLGAGVTTVSRYPCSCGTYIFSDISVPYVNSYSSLFLTCLSSHSLTISPHSFCLSSDTASSVRTPGLPSIRDNYFLQASMCLACTFMTVLLLPSLHTRCIQGVKAKKKKNWTWTQETGYELCLCENWADKSSFLPGLS